MNDDSESQVPRYPVRLVAARTGLTPHVLRAWERRYGVVRPTRTDGGQRLYSDADLERLRLLRRLTDQGHAIRRIAALPLADLARLDEGARTGEAPGAPTDGRRHGTDRSRQLHGAPHGEPRGGSVGDAVAAAVRATRRFDDVELHAVLERAAVTLGVPAFLDEVVAPVLARIGDGWAEGSVSVAQEHMATAVFRRVLGWLLGMYEVRSSAPRLVVATPPHELHELGALMAAASAAAEGWNVTYLGADLPVADLMSAAGQIDARAVAISTVHLPEDADLPATLRTIRAGLSERVPLLVGGTAARKLEADAEAAGALVIESLPEFRTALRRLAAEDAE